MTGIFEQVLTMSLAGSLVILLLLPLRLVLKKAPRICAYVLWLAALVRLLCPVTLTAPVSMVPRSFDSEALVRSWVQELDVPEAIPETGTDALPSMDPVPASEAWDWMPVLSGLWLAGAVLLSLGSLVPYGRLRRKLDGAVAQADGYYLADHIPTPFVLGVLRPRIYLPSDLPEDRREYILAHERQHIRRLDHVVKLLAFGAVCVHWFNPLVWLMFRLLVRDMEMSCDEAVLKRLGPDARADYSQLLLNLTVSRGPMTWTPLAFGENDISGRIRNVLSWRRPAAAVTVLSLILAWAVTVSAAVDPVPMAEAPAPQISGITGGTIVRRHDPEEPQPLTDRQTELLEKALEQAALLERQTQEMQLQFTLLLMTENGECQLSCGVAGGDAVIYLRQGNDLWQVEDETLCWLAQHIYTCTDGAPLTPEMRENGTLSHSQHHRENGHGGLDTYGYYCDICGRSGTAVVSGSCNCLACRQALDEVERKHLALLG